MSETATAIAAGIITVVGLASTGWISRRLIVRARAAWEDSGLPTFIEFPEARSSFRSHGKPAPLPTASTPSPLTSGPMASCFRAGVSGGRRHLHVALTPYADPPLGNGVLLSELLDDSDGPEGSK